MTEEKIQVSRFLRRFCCTHSRSLLALWISLSLCLCLEGFGCLCQQSAALYPCFPHFRHSPSKCGEFSEFCSPNHRNLARMVVSAFLATFLALAEFSLPLPFPGEDIDFHRIIVSVHTLCRLEDASAPQEILCCHTQIGRSVHQAQLSVSFEPVVSGFSHHFARSFLLYEHREQVQQCRRLQFVW